MGTLIKALFHRPEKARLTIRQIATTTADGRTIVRTGDLMQREEFKKKADELQAFAERVVAASNAPAPAH